MDAASRRLGRCALVLSAVLAWPAAAIASQDAVLRLLQQKASESAVALGARIEACDRLKAGSETPSIEPTRVSTADAATVRAAIAYLSRRNFARCEGPSRLQMAYDLGTMRAVAAEYGVTSPELEALPEITTELLYPSARDMELQLAYERLPEPVRQYLDVAVGDTPFDLAKALAAFRAAEAK